MSRFLIDIPHRAVSVGVLAASVLMGLICLGLALPAGVGAAVPTGADRTALEALYDAANGAGWTNDTHWKTDDGDWYGVTTNSSGQVTRLSLSNNKLSGTIPTALGQLTHLTTLSLQNNDLSGTIPTQLENLTGLTRLDLSRNDLSEPHSDTIGELDRAHQAGPLPQ